MWTTWRDAGALTTTGWSGPPPPDIQRFGTLYWRTAVDYKPADTQIVVTADGPMFVFAHDAYISRSLAVYGEFSGGETELFRQLLRPGYLAVEAGANIGAHSLAIARAVSPGRLICFEPQPRVAQLLSGNLALNNIQNATVHTAGLSDQAGWAYVPLLKFSKMENVGSVHLRDAPEASPFEMTRAPVTTLDEWELPSLNFLKLDTEGHESRILNGARATIKRCRPIIYFENDRAAHQGPTIEILAQLEYDQYWHSVPMFRPSNFNRYPDDIFTQTYSLNTLAIPAELRTNVAGFEKIDPHNWRSPIPVR
jgi:FkbM family methyltransferase